MAMGSQGEPVLLEDALDLVDFLEWSRRIPPRNLWVDELRTQAEGDAMKAMFNM